MRGRMEHITTPGEAGASAAVTAYDPQPAGGKARGTGSGPMVDARFLARLLVAVVGSALIMFVIWTNRPTELTGHINLVGYGDFTDYNYVWFLAYRLVTYGFPVGVIVIYLLLDWRGPLRGTRSNPRAESVPLLIPAGAEALAEASTTTARRVPLGCWLSLIAPAIVVGVVVQPGAALSLSDGVPLRITSALLYSVTVVGAAGLVFIASRLRVPAHRRSFGDILFVVNAAAEALVAFGALWLASRRTVVVLQNGTSHHWQWLPWWLAALGAAAAWVWIAHQLRRGRESGPTEQRLRYVVLGSAAMYLIVAAIPGPVGSFQGFDDAQNLTGAALLQRGYFPWRDFTFIHGFWTDVVSALIGFHIFEPTSWGSQAGTDLVLRPLLWVALYLLGVWTARRGALVVLGTLALAATGILGGDPRLIAVPLTLILLGKALSSRRLAWTSALAVVLFIEGVMVPETDYLVIAAFAVLVAAELVHRQPGQRLTAILRRTLWFIGVGAILTVAWLAFLASHHALTAFIDWYLVFVPGHDAEGTLHPYTQDVPISVIFALFVAFAVITIIAAGLRARHRCAWTPVAWVTLAAALNAAVYGEQAIARFDTAHESLSVQMGLPLIVLCIASAVPAIERFLMTQLDRVRRSANRTTWRPQPVSVSALVVGVLLIPTLRFNLLHIPLRTRMQFAGPVTRGPLGYEVPGVVPRGLLADLRSVLSTYAPRNAPFFDMTDSPGYFYYLLGARPASKFTNVSLAIPAQAQRLLVDDLRRTRPPLIAFNTATFGLGPWDGVEVQVRHFIVSQYVLDGWTPIVSVRGVLFLLRNDLLATKPPLPHFGQTPVTKDLYNSQGSCDWGDAPNFLASPPVGPSVTVSAHRSQHKRVISAAGWAFDKAAEKPASEIIAATGRRAVATMPLGVNRPDVASYLRDPAAAASGFQSSVAVPITGPVHLYALTNDGVLHPLPGVGSPAVAPRSIRMPDGSVHPVGTQALGNVDALDQPIEWLTSFRLRGSSALPSYQLATLGASHRIGYSSLELSNVPGGNPPPGAAITASALPVTGSRLPVRVGSCLQWHGYRGHSLYLVQQGGSPITSLTLSGVKQ